MIRKSNLPAYFLEQITFSILVISLGVMIILKAFVFEKKPGLFNGWFLTWGFQEYWAPVAGFAGILVCVAGITGLLFCILKKTRKKGNGSS